MAGSLSEAQKAAYAREGYLCPLRVMETDQALQMRGWLETLEASPPALPRELGQYLRINAHLVMREVADMAFDPRILDAVESLLGPDLMLWSAEFFVKEAGSEKIVSWHQDLTYWGMDGSDHEVTAWIALSPATAASGCMRFVPGSHRREIVAHRDSFAEDNLLSRGQEIAVDVDEAEAVDAALRPGEMSLHHGRLFHASGPNTSGDRRIGLVFRFIRPDTPATGTGRDYAMMVRGMDRHGLRGVAAPPAASFSPGALAVYDEVLATQADTLADGAEEGVALYS